MKMGVPEIATNWSSNVEFMPPEAACMVDYTLVPVNDRYQFDNGELVWAEADVHQAAGYLKKLKEDPAFRRRIGAAGQAVIQSQLTTAQCGERIRKRVREILGPEGFG